MCTYINEGMKLIPEHCFATDASELFLGKPHYATIGRRRNRNRSRVASAKKFLAGILQNWLENSHKRLQCARDIINRKCMR